MALESNTSTDEETTNDALLMEASVARIRPETHDDIAQQRALEERASRTLDQIDSLQRQLFEEDTVAPPSLGFELPARFLLSIVVPIYNEEATIARVISKLFTLPVPIQVIAVDDGSTDGTRELLRELGEQYPALTVALQERNQGKGAALRRGFSLATGTHVMVQDADLEYNPDDIPSLLEPLAKQEADVVYGSRFLEQRWEGSSFVHRLGNSILTKASNLWTGWKLTDMETCYKVFRRDLLNRFTLEQDKFGFEVELTSKLARLKARVVELPISYDARGWEEGKKIGWKDAVQALYCICLYR